MERETELLEITSLFKNLIKKATQEWNKHMDDQLSISQFRMLYFLNAKGMQKVMDLANMLCLTPGAITGLADKLIQRDFVERERGEEDRRVVYLKITVRGLDMLNALLDKQSSALSVFFGGLPDEDMQHLKRIFTQMINKYDSMDKE